MVKQALLSALKKLAAGAAYGSGFAVGFIIIFNLATSLWPVSRDISVTRKVLGSSKGEKRVYVPKTASDPQLQKLLVQEVNAINREHAFEILGTLVNESERTWQFVILRADLYDNAGNFIYQCDRYIDEQLRPGESINFKIPCPSLSKELKNYARHAIRVVDAY